MKLELFVVLDEITRSTIAGASALLQGRNCFLSVYFRHPADGIEQFDWGKCYRITVEEETDLEMLRERHGIVRSLEGAIVGAQFKTIIVDDALGERHGVVRDVP